MFANSAAVLAIEKYALEIALELRRKPWRRGECQRHSEYRVHVSVRNANMTLKYALSPQLPYSTEFKYLGSTQYDATIDTMVQRISVYRKLSRVICDNRIPPHMKGNTHNIMVVHAVVWDGLGGDNDGLPCEETGSGR